jgi:NAD(P)-dependent dehydrogenase (short-subunit alcohol dehydrogenase family)
MPAASRPFTPVREDETMADRLQGKRCLIVGGTSGIGLAAASRFLEEEAKLVVAGLEMTDSQVHSIRTDVRHPDQVAVLFQETISILGGLDVLFHVAGGSGRKHGDGPLHDCSDEGWRFTLDLNLTSTFLTNRAAIRQFLAQKSGGAILNVSTMLAVSPSPYHFDTVAYTAAKGGVNALSRLAAARYAQDGIRVNVLAPGERSRDPGVFGDQAAAGQWAIGGDGLRRGRGVFVQRRSADDHRARATR